MELKKFPLPRILIYQNGDIDTLKDYLAINGFQVNCATTNDVLSKLRERDFDLCILDRGASTDEPLGALNFIRSIDTKVPIIFLSEDSDYASIIKAFDAGVDDYVTKPYNIEEFIRRVRALLRRCGIKIRSIEPTYNIGSYVFDTKAQTLKLGDITTTLTPRESGALALLCAYKNEVLPKEILCRNLWRDDNYFVRRSLDVHICMLRKHLNQDEHVKISTVRGAGYALTIEQ